MALTKDQIFAAADQIDATGQRPTLSAVRKALGTGSFTTINDAMKEWTARKATIKTPLREAPPQVVLDQMSELGVEIWSIALELANGRLSSERDALEDARVQLETARAEAAELADQMSVELEALKDECAVQDTTIADLRKVLQAREVAAAIQAQDLASANARLEETTKRADQLNAELVRVGALNSELISAISSVKAIDKSD